MSDLVGNPEDRFSHNEAHISSLAVQAGFSDLVGNICFEVSNFMTTTSGSNPDGLGLRNGLAVA